MPKSKSVPSYRYHKARDCAVVTINGRNFYLGKFNSAESRERYGRLIAELAATGVAAPSPRSLPRLPLTITELCVAHWQWAQGYYQRNGVPTGQLHVVQMALREARKLYGGTFATDFGPLAFRALQESMVAAGRSRNVINQLCAVVRRMFRWAASHEMLPATIFQSLATVPGLKRGRCQARETAPVLPVDHNTVEATLPFLPPVVIDMVKLQALVGCRPTEVCLIRPDDVDTSGEVWVYVPAEHKTQHHGRERKIFIGPKAQDILRPYLLRPADAYCFSPVDSERKRHEEMRERRKSKVQPSQLNRSKAKPKLQPHERYTKDSYNRAVARAVDKANAAQVKALAQGIDREPTQDEANAVKLPKWSPSQLRHSVATTIRRKYGVEGAQVILGHSRADVTQVYAARDWDKAAAIAKAIG